MNSINVDILAFQESHLYNISDTNRVIINNQNLDFIFQYRTAMARDIDFAIRRNMFDEVSQLAFIPDNLGIEDKTEQL